MLAAKFCLALTFLNVKRCYIMVIAKKERR